MGNYSPSSHFDPSKRNQLEEEEERRRRKKSVVDDRLRINKERRNDNEDIEEETDEFDSPGVDVEKNIESKNVVIVGCEKTSIARNCVGEKKKGIEYPEVGFCYIKQLSISSVKIWVAESDVDYESLAEYLGEISALVVTFSVHKLESYDWSKELIEKLLVLPSGGSSSPIFPIILIGNINNNSGDDEEEQQQSSRRRKVTSEECEEFVKNKRMVRYFEVSNNNNKEEEVKKCFDFVFNSIDVF